MTAHKFTRSQQTQRGEMLRKRLQGKVYEKKHSSEYGEQGRPTSGAYVPLLQIYPSPENDKLYRPIDDSDPALVALSESIGERGILEPLVVSADDFIISGHRRFAAARLANLKTVPCRRLPIRRDLDPDGFFQLLREHNRQRDKTNAEKLREEVVSLSKEEAHARLYEYRRTKAAVGATPLQIKGTQQRKEISGAKTPMLDAVIGILEKHRQFWPLSDRQIHYGLLNDPPLKHASKPKSTYANDAASYKSLTDLLTRARLEALPPETLQQLVREAIEGVLDRDAFAAEIEAERNDAVFLANARRLTLEALPELYLDDGE